MNRTISILLLVLIMPKNGEKGLFRKNLWYRLNVFPITALLLRERIEDIARLENYSRPGNIRELENFIEQAVINSSGSKLKLAEKLDPAAEKTETNFQTLEEMEHSYILKVLKKTNWKVCGKNSASEILGLQRSTLRARMDKYKIRKP